MQYQRNETDFSRGTFRVRGDTIDVFAEHWPRSVPSCLTTRSRLPEAVRPAHQLHPPNILRPSPFTPRATTTPAIRAVAAIETIKEELRLRPSVELVKIRAKLVEAQRLEQRNCLTSRCCRRVSHRKGIDELHAPSPAWCPASRRRRWSTTAGRFADAFLDGFHARSASSAACSTATARARRCWWKYGFRPAQRAGQPGR